MMIWILITLLPTLFEVWQDRNGETEKDKYKDGFWLLVVAGTIAGLSYWFGQNPISVVLLIFAWRILAFDYLVTYLLIKNDVINPNAKWWNYTGKTSKWDRLISRVDWRVRLIVRIALFVLALLLFLWQ